MECPYLGKNKERSFVLAVRGEAAPPSREGSILKDRLGERCQSEVYLRPIELDADIQQQLVTELTPLTGEGFLRKDKCAQDLIDDVAHHVLDCDRLTVIRQDDELVAFVAASIVEHNGDIFYHLEGIIVHPDYHGAGLSVDALRKDIAATQADYLAFHTQSSRMLGLGNELADNNHVDSVQFAGLIGTRHQDGIVDKGRYGGQCLYEDQEKFAQTAIQSIDWRSGDAMICIGPIKEHARTATR